MTDNKPDKKFKTRITDKLVKDHPVPDKG